MVMMIVLLIVLILAIYLIYINLRLSKDNSLKEILLKNLSSYVFLVDEDFNVKETNYYALNMGMKRDQPDVLGNVLRCKNGCDAGLCGKGLDCNKCLIRKQVKNAFNTKTDFRDVEAVMSLYDSKNVAKEVDVNVGGKYVQIDGKPYIVVNVKDMTQDKEVLRSVMAQQVETEIGSKYSLAQRLEKVSEIFGHKHVADAENLPRILFATLNVVRFNTVKDYLRDKYNVIYADSNNQVLFRVDGSVDCNYDLLLLDESFVYTNSIMDKIIDINPNIPIMVITSDTVYNDNSESIQYVSDTASKEELLQKINKVIEKYKQKA